MAEVMEVKTTVASELPTARCMHSSAGKPRWRYRKNKAGTITIPPPRPKRPAKRPATAPSER